ncbi:FAD-dependent monooxygenase [Aequorivita marina]|uniref:FAD-dependent monooxygenase n=1 Tax=Aequorivita marina TaxID=3073654 RepID=UPI002876C428|nr:FAD-dependent monooxygenase [Aequorivita sp. S2608]MDS1299198.1 FAD-dependent monooxygenase [Aequorivita sp. S2608]
MKISIIGAGIGGLTSAIALKQKGFEVEIFEASKELKKAGSGINLAINAMQVFKRLGIYNKISALGSYTDSMLITDEKLNTITKVNLENAELEHKVKTYAIHRATLHNILVNELNGIKIHLGKKIKSLNQVKDEVNFTFEDDTSYTTNILIGADGIHSVVRKSIIDNTEIRKAKQVCWRGIVKMDIPKKYQAELNELWGKGKRFGFVKINENEVYWYALANYKTDYKKEFYNAHLEELFSNFSPLVKEIISTTEKRNVIFNEMMDLKPISSWHYKNVCLIGDASHATTPNLGQGACQAIETAFVIAECLSTENSTNLAFQKLEKIRKKNAEKVINTSWTVGRTAHLDNRVGIFFRNNIMKLIPKIITEKKSTSIYKLNY